MPHGRMPWIDRRRPGPFKEGLQCYTHVQEQTLNVHQETNAFFSAKPCCLDRVSRRAEGEHQGRVNDIESSSPQQRPQ